MIDPTNFYSEHDYERALGRLARYFSLLHYALERFAWRIWGLHTDFAHVLTKDLPTKHLSEKVLKSLKETQLDPKIQDELRPILKSIETLAQQRNDLLHALWIFDDGKPVECYTRREPRCKNKAQTPEEIHKLNDAIVDAADELLKFESRHPVLNTLASAHNKMVQDQKFSPPN